jgi:hypothetical protein
MITNLVNNESERSGREVVVAQFEVPYQNLPGKTEVKPQKHQSR